MNYSARKSLAARAIVLGIASALVIPNYAQVAPAAGAESGEEVVRLERFEVTGSYIPVAGTATAIPVTTLSAQSIADTGVTTNVLEVLRKAAPQFMGNGNLGNANANIASGATGGGSQLAFRNTQTLVLINGRRSAYAPIVASGGFQFVDVNLIPISAIEKIEILQDGASAIYGTDAVAGVVNIILRSDFKGMEVGINYGFSDNPGNYAVRKGWVVTGASNDRTGVTVSGEWTKADPLYQRERGYTNPIYGTATFAGIINTLGGQFYVLNPSLNAPPMNQDLTLAQLVANGTYIPIANASNLISGLGPEAQYSFNLANFPTILLANERQAAMINFDHRWTDNVSVFADFMYSLTKTFSQLNAQPSAAVLAGSAPSNPSNETLVVRNRFLQYPRQYFYTTTNVRATIGARGEFGDNWRWEAAALRNRVEQSYRNPGLINTASRVAAVANGTINYFARNQAPGAVESSGMFGEALGTAVSELISYDARVSGKLFDLPAGELGIAVGAEQRTEKMTQTADRGSQGATFSWDTATTLDPFSADRDISAVFANVRIPLLGSTSGNSMLLEFEAAVRHEKYSDTDDPTVPKFALRYLPFNDEFALRATYSESFAAPTLFQLFGPGGIGFTSSLNLQRAGGGPAITGQANARSGANSNLRPATSDNYTFGFVWSPKNVRGLSLSVDYFSVEQIDLISTIGTATILQSVELLGTASPYAQFVRFGPRGDVSQFTAGAPVTGVGQIGARPIDESYVTDTLVNIARQELAGVDVKIDYTWATDSMGRFDASLAGIWWAHYRAQTLPNTAEFDTVGLATFFNGTIPDWQTYLSVRWSQGPWAATFGWQHIPAVTDENWFSATDPAADANVEAFNSFDVAFAYTFGSQSGLLNGLTLKLGATNVFNEGLPMAKGSFSNENGDVSTYGAVGRFMFVEATYRF